MNRLPRPDGPAPPLLTFFGCGVVTTVFLANFVLHIQDASGTFEPLGYALPLQIWSGAYWALVTSAFTHVEFFHFLFNLYWFWLLGSAFELEFGPERWLAF